MLLAKIEIRNYRKETQKSSNYTTAELLSTLTHFNFIDPGLMGLEMIIII